MHRRVTYLAHVIFIADGGTLVVSVLLVYKVQGAIYRHTICYESIYNMRFIDIRHTRHQCTTCDIQKHIGCASHRISVSTYWRLCLEQPTPFCNLGIFCCRDKTVSVVFSAGKNVLQLVPESMVPTRFISLWYFFVGGVGSLGLTAPLLFYPLGDP